MKYIDLPDNDIVNYYLNDKFSITKISKIFNVSRETISLRLHKNNISIRKKGSHLRKYALDEKYFDNIDSENKAYFLGLLYADGCNHFSDKRISLSLQEGDKDILSKFSSLLYNAEFLQFVKGRNGSKNQFCLNIHSVYMSNKLNELGCVARKSLILEFPQWLIGENLKRHFIRGYFDGDGSISSSKRRNRQDYVWSIISTNSFCNDVSKFINEELGTHSGTKLHFGKRLTCPGNNITTTISVRGNYQILKLMNWLYKDSTIYLDRKFKKYLELKSIYAI